MASSTRPQAAKALPRFKRAERHWGLPSSRPLKVFDGFVPAAALGHRHAKMVVNGRIVGCNFRGLLEEFLCFVSLAAFQENLAQIIAGVGIVRIDVE